MTCKFETADCFGVRLLYFRSKTGRRRQLGDGSTWGIHQKTLSDSMAWFIQPGFRVIGLGLGQRSEGPSASHQSEVYTRTHGSGSNPVGAGPVVAAVVAA